MNDKSIHVRLPVETLEAMRALSHFHGIDIARYARKLIQDAVFGRGRTHKDVPEYFSMPEEKPKRSHVYVIKCGDLYKIGRSNRPTKRMLAMQLPQPPEVIVTIESLDAPALEASLHHSFRDKRQHGEWFRLNESDLAVIRKMAA